MSGVIDWETWSIGDPRIDLGWLLMTLDPVAQPHSVRTAPGVPSPAELVDAYSRHAQQTPSQLDWFVALSQYRAGAMTALIVKHDRRRAHRDPMVEQWDPAVPRSFVELARLRLQ